MSDLKNKAEYSLPKHTYGQVQTRPRLSSKNEFDHIFSIKRDLNTNKQCECVWKFAEYSSNNDSLKQNFRHKIHSDLA